MQGREGVWAESPRYGSTWAMNALDPSAIIAPFSQYFGPIIRGFESVGYTDLKDMFGSGFNWLKFPTASWFDSTRELVERASAHSGGEKVVLAAHSMGCPFSYLFLMSQTLEWRQKYIHRWVPVSGPWTGTPLTLVGMVSGYTFGLPIDKSKVALLERTVPAAYFLLPNPDFSTWKGVPLVTEPDRTWTADDIGEMLVGKLGTPFGAKVVNQSRSLFSPVPGKLGYEHPGIPMTVFSSHGVETIVGLRYKSKGDLLSVPSDDANAPEPEIIFDDGDGTVAFQSQMFACDHWGLVGDECVILSNVSHFNTIKDPSVIKRIIQFAIDD